MTGKKDIFAAKKARLDLRIAARRARHRAALDAWLDGETPPADAAHPVMRRRRADQAPTLH